ncbi:MAG: TlpA family protein disulfide reductase [Planctomycetes bacterium]|nr:TlpA family protein disulfide reductase [Planctomycetota bacterium]
MTPAPQEALLPRTDLEGLKKVIAETAAQRKVLVLDFWATWCPPCVALFDPLHRELGAMSDRVRLVSVTLDADETEPAAFRYLREHGAMKDAFLLVPDTNKRLAVVRGLANTWSDLVVPTLLVYDTEGKLAAEIFPQDERVEPIVEKVKAVLAGPATAPTEKPR